MQFQNGYIKLHVLGAIVFVIPKDYGRGDLTDGGGRGSSSTPWKGVV
jgi:hypothetical protein